MRAKNKQLLRAAILPVSVALLRFGGGALLAQFDMGWRCGPRYTMDFILMVLLVVTAFRFIWILGTPADKVPPYSPLWLCSFVALVAAMFIIPASMLVWSVSSMDNLSEEIVVRDGQTMVREYKINGGAVSYCYAPINGLVHGEDLNYDWWAPHPFPKAESTVD